MIRTCFDCSGRALSALDAAVDAIGAWTGIPCPPANASGHWSISRPPAEAETACSYDLTQSLNNADDEKLGRTLKGHRRRPAYHTGRIPSPFDGDAAQLTTHESHRPATSAHTRRPPRPGQPASSTSSISRGSAGSPGRTADRPLPPNGGRRGLPGGEGHRVAARSVGEGRRQAGSHPEPDGTFSDAERASGGFAWSGTAAAGRASIGRVVATPQLRAEIDAWLAKFAAPGMCNPDDQTPTVTGEPTQEAIDRDARSSAQRQHDALSALVRGQLGDPKLVSTMDCR